LTTCLTTAERPDGFGRRFFADVFAAPIAAPSRSR
jgi:hypothetical protein